MTYSVALLALTFFTMFQTVHAQPDLETDPLRVELRSEPTTWNLDQGGVLKFTLRLPQGFHAYEDQFKVEIVKPEGFKFSKFTLQPAIEFYDKFSKKNRRGIKDSAELILPVEAPSRWLEASDEFKVLLTYQACSEKFCLFPVTKELRLQSEFVGAEKLKQDLPASTQTQESQLALLTDSKTFEKLLNENLILAFFLIFLAGILTSFTPCIFPMIPITLAVIGQNSEKRTRLQNFLLSVSYVHGIAFTYSLLGVIAAKTGALFGASLGHPLVLAVLCFLFLIMSLSMYGFYELQVPSWIRQKFGATKTEAGYVGAFVSGLIAGIVASPCVGPVLVTLLAWVATSGSLVYGFFMLFTYAMGLGLIFLVLGAFTELTRKLPRSGPWLETTKFVMATLMLGVFYYYLSFIIAQRWHDLALGGGLVVMGSLVGAFTSIHGSSLFARLKKGLAQTVFYVGLGFIIFGIFNLRQYQLIDPNPQQKTQSRLNWQDYDEALIEKAKQNQQAVVIDFWADWCAACHELEEKTFSRPRVQMTLQNFVLLKFDATKDSPQVRELKKKWKIQGLPTVIFIDQKGVWREDLTLTQFEDEEKFYQRLNQVSR